MKRNIARSLLVSASALSIAQLQHAWAQSPPAAPAAKTARIEEVVVTAQKRRERLQNVPIAVTALSQTALKNAGVTSLAELGQVAPGLQVTQAIGIYAQPVLRSVGTSSHGPGIENPIATYVDGVYFVAATSTLMSLFDIDQVAVLKGPQGTLFGRNATGGLIQITTKLPTQPFHADLEETIGNVGTFNQDLYLNGGLTPTLAGNLAVAHDVQSQGFGRNLYNGNWIGTFHDLAVRGKLRWQPDAETDIILSGDYSHRQGADIDTRALGLIPTGTKEPGGWWDIDDNITPYEHYRGNGTSLTVRHDFGVAQLASITAYRSSYTNSAFDGNDLATPSVAISGPQLDNQFSEELQLLSPDNQRLTWATGLYYLDADEISDPLNSVIYANPFFQDYNKVYVDSRVESYAAFGQGTYKIDPATDITAGLRYTADFRQINSSAYNNFNGTLNPNNTLTFSGPFFETATFSDRKNFAEPSGRLSIDHRFSPELMVYTSYNRGFRSGSFDPGAVPNTELHPETLDALEAGFKSDLLDHRLRFNAATYFYEYHNRQVQFIYNGIELDYDAAKAQSYGVDADLTAYVTDQLSLTGGISAVHAVYTSFPDAFITTANPNCTPATCSTVNFVNPSGNATGKFIENTPFWTLNLTPSYDIPTSSGDVTVTAAYFHNGGWYGDPDNRVRQRAYDTVAADIAWVPSFATQVAIKIWGKNLTNAQYANQITSSNSADNANVAPGRTYGLTVDEHF